MKPRVIWIPPGLSCCEAAIGHYPVWVAGQDQAITLDEAVPQTPEPVVLVLAAGDVLLAEAELTRQQARHLRKILPFVLEDQLALPVEEQCIIAGPATDNRYPVAVIENRLLELLLGWVHAHDSLLLEAITVDAWVLAEETGDIEHHHQQLLRSGISAVWVDAQERDAWASVLPPSPPTELRQSLLPALDKHLGRVTQLNFLQGRFAPRTRLWPWTLDADWYRLGLTAAAVLVLWVGSLYLLGWQYQRAAADAWQQASAHYNRIFPNDVATPMLESQFRRQLASLTTQGAGQSPFIVSSARLENSFEPSSAGWQARRLAYDDRDQVINLDVDARQYDQLEALRQQLEAQGAVAEIANFRNQGNDQVSARIRLSVGGTP